MEKYDTAGQATDDNIIRRMRITCWITKATNTHISIRTTYGFSTVKMVKRKRLNITLYAHDLSCFCVESLEDVDNAVSIRGLSVVELQE